MLFSLQKKTVFVSSVADLLVKLAKDKFGAIQTEYQKVRERVFKLLFCCAYLSALVHFVFCFHLNGDGNNNLRYKLQS